MKWDGRIGRRLKLHDLHVFLTVAEVGSMNKAAERLAISQPSISKAIGDLEHTLGVRLFDRTPKGVECTPYGRALLERGLGAFDELRQGVKDIASLADPTVGEVRVGCPEAIAAGLMLETITRFSCEHPRVLVSVTPADNMSNEFRLLRDRQVDLLVGALPQPFVQNDLDAEILYRDRPYCLCGREHKLARRRRIAFADLADEPWLLPRESVFSSHITQAFNASGLSVPNIGVRSYSVHQRIALLITNRFVSAESGSTLRFNGARFGIKVLSVDYAFQPWPVGIVTLKKRTLSPVVHTFIKSLRDMAKQMAKPS